MGLKRYLTVAAIVTMFLLVLSQTFGTFHFSGLPKVNEILFKAYPGATPEVIVDEFLVRETEWMDGPYRKDLYDQVVDAGHKISPKDPAAEFDFIAINCRDHKQTAGTPNFPLNDSAFRLALSYIYGMDDKMTDIYGYVQADWTFALNNCVPPAQEPWFDNAVTMPDTDWDLAWTILQYYGYVINASDGNALYCNGVKVRDIDVMYSTGNYYWEFGPGGGLVTAFNGFIAYIGASSPAFNLVPVDFITLLMELMMYRDFDLICWTITDLGIYVDWLYDMLHSDNAGSGGSNLCGIIDPDFDDWTEIILTSLSEAAIITAASNVQNKFVYELMPWFPVSTGTVFCSSWRGDGDELMNIISMPNYGPMNDWSWMAMHWNSSWPGGTVKVALGDAPNTLNPWNEDSPYGWQMLDRTEADLLMRRPEDLTLIPFVATNWTLVQWDSIPELSIVNGSTATFYLRQDVTWHDGYTVNAHDCVNNLRIMREYQPPMYSKIWTNLVYEESDGPYKLIAYFYTTSLYNAAYVAETALLASKHVMDVVEDWVETGTLTSIFEWAPAFNPYVDLGLGLPPIGYPFMKQIVGCGPFVFDYYDKSLAIGRVEKYDDFFVSAPVIAGAYGEWRSEPGDTYNYTVLVQNLGAKEDSPAGELTSMTVNVSIYEDDVWVRNVTNVILDPWDWQYLGPYATGPLATGLHTIKVEVYGSGLIHTYTLTLVATISEDISTCSGEDIDFLVDLQDIIWIAYAFGTSPGDPRWYPSADVCKDFRINVADLTSVAKKFGWGGAILPEEPPVPQEHEVFLIAEIPKTVVCQTCNFTVYIHIVNVTNLCGYEILMDYNTTFIEFLYVWALTPPPQWGSVVYEVPGYMAVTGLGNFQPFNGSITLATINFTAKVKGNVTLDLSNSDLVSGCSVSFIDYTAINGNITISYIGDLTGGGATPWDFVPDGLVDGQDQIVVAACFGAWPTAPPPMIWHPNCDVNNDGVIDGSDLIIIAAHFGEQDP